MWEPTEMVWAEIGGLYCLRKRRDVMAWIDHRFRHALYEEGNMKDYRWPDFQSGCTAKHGAYDCLTVYPGRQKRWCAACRDHYRGAFND